MGENTNLSSVGKDIIIIGDNFVSEELYTDFKRYSKFKVKKINSVNVINNNLNVYYIIDCTFNNKSQDDTLNYIKDKKTNLIILNHWKRYIGEYNNIIIQIVIPDIYNEKHPSFDRLGSGNNYENDINYCSLISESIRRIHESKIGFIPNTYIRYSEETIKYLYVRNLYKSIDYVIYNIKKSSEYEIFDEYKNINIILNKIKEIIGYNGNIIFQKTESRSNKQLKRLPFKYNYPSFENNIKHIYSYLNYNNERFVTY